MYYTSLENSHYLYPNSNVCCPHNPILINGCLAFRCVHEGAYTYLNTIFDIFGYYILNKDCKPLTFDKLDFVGMEYTDRYGNLKNYNIKENHDTI